MNTRAVVFRIKSRRRSGVRWADATTISYSTPNSARIEPAFFPTSASLLEPRTTSTSTGIVWEKEGLRIKACAPLSPGGHPYGGRGVGPRACRAPVPLEKEAAGGEGRIEPQGVL